MLLGLVHGPAELLPISSSAHTTVLPWLIGSPTRPEAELRKSFEVALHAGAVAGWLISPATGAAGIVRSLVRPTRQESSFLLLATAPAAAAGLLLERPIERRLGTPDTIAAGLVAGALAMTIADRAPEARAVDEARGADGLWLGLAQAAALLPGVSRSGATLAAARLRGFTRPASRRLSARVGLPVILGATGLRLIRTLQSSGDERRWLGVGAGASFLSTLLLARPLTRAQDTLPLAPFAAYRAVLAAVIVARLRTGET
jgi:undecaprenyl-diphosphatase